MDSLATDTELKTLKVKWLQWNGYRGTPKQIAKVTHRRYASPYARGTGVS